MRRMLQVCLSLRLFTFQEREKIETSQDKKISTSNVVSLKDFGRIVFHQAKSNVLLDKTPFACFRRFFYLLQYSWTSFTCILSVFSFEPTLGLLVDPRDYSIINSDSRSHHNAHHLGHLKGNICRDGQQSITL